MLQRPTDFSLPRVARLAGAITLGALLIVQASCAGAAAHEPAPPASRTSTSPPLTDAQRAAQLASFDQVWTTIRDKHWDPKLNGVDWDAARAELRPRVENAATAGEARAAIENLIARLGQSHFGLLPADVYERLDPAPAASGDQAANAGYGDIGAHVRIVDGVPLITSVVPGSSADAAGIRPGWVIQRIDDLPASDILAAAAEHKLSPTLAPAMLSRGFERRLSGPIRSTVRLQLLDEHDQSITKIVARGQPAGNAAHFGNLPTFYVTYEQRRLPASTGQIGYIAFSAFLDMPRVLGQINRAIPDFADTRGLIIDLRGNPGGIGIMAVGIGGWFVDKPDQRLGTMKTRDLTLDFVLNPRPEPYHKPLAILVDECSLSTSEVLAGGLQGLGRARIFGTPTGGAALPSVIDRLPSGDGFQYAVADYVSVSGVELEAHGVIPDVPAPPTREALLAGHDPALEAAIRWIDTSAAR